MLTLLLGTDWVANRNEIFSRVADDIAHARPERVLLVPELNSHESERALCRVGGDTASRYAEVLSFTRLARRVAQESGSANLSFLDAGGRIVAMAAAARQLSSRLKAYAAVETKPEFLVQLVDAVEEFKRCCITPENLSAASAALEGSLAQKLEELALLMEAYDALCAQGKRDPEDQITWLIERLYDGDYAARHVFYIDGFPDFTRQHLAVLEALIRQSPSVTISLNCDKPDSRALAFEKAGATARQILTIARRAEAEVNIVTVPARENKMRPLREKLFQGSLTPGALAGSVVTAHTDGVWDECVRTARETLEYMRGGGRCRDVSVVVSDLTAYEPILMQVFARFHIPLYRAGTEDILQQSVVYTVLTALDTVLGGFEKRSVLEYLRSALSPLEPDVCDKVENYAMVWNLRGNAWLTPWKLHPDGLSAQFDDDSRARLDELERARQTAMEPMARLRRGLADATCVRDMVRALYDFLERLHMAGRLEQLSADLLARGESRDAQILEQLWEILLSALEQLYDMLGDAHWKAEHFARLLRLLLSQYDVGTIPPVLDAVQLGTVSAMRCHRQKRLYVLGAEEGALPGYTGSAGLLNDTEREQLRAVGVPLTGGGIEGMEAEFAEIYGVFSAAGERVTVFCSSAQPSFLFDRLETMAGGESESKVRPDYADADGAEAAAYLAAFAAEDEAHALGLDEEYASALARADYAPGDVSDGGIRALYGRKLNLSASQLDVLAECRLRYFLQYGLRVRERREAAVDPAEFGTYVHAVLENTAREVRDRGGFHVVSLEDTKAIAHGYSESYARERFDALTSERVQYLFRRNLQELDMVVEELWQELSASAFAPLDFEVGFGRDEALPAIALPNAAMEAFLRGFVDRVDVFEGCSGRYYRVVDYKTGKKDFDYCDIFNGVGLQMLLYLFALKAVGTGLLGENARPAGVQYFPARVPYLPMDAKPRPDETTAERVKQWKRKGLLLQDDEVLRAVEPGDKPTRSFKRKADGTPQGDFADREQLKTLEKYVFTVVKKLVEDLASGCVEANPYTRGSAHNACRFCPYGEICHSDEVPGRRNYQVMSAERFWQEVGKELDTDA